MPSNTEVELSPVSMLGTYGSAKGSTFESIVKKDVIVDGFIVIRAGAKAQGTILDSTAGDRMQMIEKAQEAPQQHAHGWFKTPDYEKKGPPLDIRFDWAQGIDGLKLRLGDLTTQGDSNGNFAQTEPRPDYLLQTVNTIKSTSIFSRHHIDVDVASGAGTIPPSQVFIARVRGPVHTTSSVRVGDTSSDGFAH